MASYIQLSLLGLILIVGSSGNACGEPAPDQSNSAQHYQTAIKPLLEGRCYACHGALQQQAGLRVDTIQDMQVGGDSGPVLQPGNATQSLLWQRVTESDPDRRMPPPNEGVPLSQDELLMLRTWIDGGAQGPHDETRQTDPRDHWAFQAIPPATLPDAYHNSTDASNGIDAWLAEGHRQQGLNPTDEASRPILVRRLFIDLIGVPPKASELQQCIQDRNPNWYEQLVDRLLHDSRHGERWGRHWMDIWRYSDWWGLGDQLRNSQKHIWHWRDWIVESLNADVPYDEMILQMLAADEIYAQDMAKLRATGFLARNFFLFNRHQWMDDTVEHVSKSMLGMTMNCAKCHDHKYDPVSQQDYYRMRAIFEPYHVRLDVLPGELDTTRNGLPRVYDGLPDAPTYRLIRGQETMPDKSQVVNPGMPTLIGGERIEITPVKLPREAWLPDTRPWVVEAHRAYLAKRLAVAKAALTTRTTHSAASQLAVAHAECEVRTFELRIAAQQMEQRLSSDSQLPICDSTVQRAAIQAAQGERECATLAAQLQLALAQEQLQQATAAEHEARQKGVAAAQQAVTAAVDRQRIVTDRYTPISGASWSATRFYDSTKDDPSVGFPATSTGRRSALARWLVDRRNPLTARVAVNHLWTRHMGASLVANPFDFGRKGTMPAQAKLIDWMAAELMEHGWSMKHLHRVIVTSAAYRRSSSPLLHGHEFENDPDNRWWWRRPTSRLESQVVRDSILHLADQLHWQMGGPPIEATAQERSTRRSLYFFHSNNDQNRFLAMFDEAAVKECYRREQSIVPQQSLALLNAPFVHDAAKAIARRIAQASTSDAEFIALAYEELLSVKPTPTEVEACQRALKAWNSLHDTTQHSVDLYAHLVWALLNHNDFVTLR